MEFDIVMEKQEEGGYTVYVPVLPGCISQGETKAQATKNIKEAISLYLEEMDKGKLKKLMNSISIQKAKVKAYA